MQQLSVRDASNCELKEGDKIWDPWANNLYTNSSKFHKWLLKAQQSAGQRNK